MTLEIIREETKWNPTYESRYIDQTIERDTLEECFRALYDMNRTYRYINGVNYYPKTQEMKDAYDRWYAGLDHQTRFDMYYGSGLVD